MRLNSQNRDFCKGSSRGCPGFRVLGSGVFGVRGFRVHGFTSKPHLLDQGLQMVVVKVRREFRVQWT